MDLGHSSVSHTSPKPKVLLICGISRPTTGIISNGNRSSIGPTKLNRILFIHDNFAFVTSDNWQTRWHWLCVCLLSMSVWNTCGVGWGLQTVSSQENLRSNDSASRLSQGFRAKEPSVDPIRRVNMSVFFYGSLHCQLARRSAKIQQEAELLPRDRAMRRVSWNLANCQAENTCTASPEQIEVMKLEG